ncbi:hypothetical protein [uncultured Rhodospira sp.]|uniref:hypothetical protein n=1 Tax=uncultured Rhodospira sp. TaxID=1936189 RepID=UPI00260F60C0|nr:hypothetical protein [uncultured Rhodospira sp.]
MRVFLTIVLPLLAPSLLYIAWLFLRSRTASAQGDGGEASFVSRLGDNVPWLTLVLSGAVLAIGVTTTLYVIQPTGDPDSVYTPPRMENGRILPGEMRPREEASDAAPAVPE